MATIVTMDSNNIAVLSPASRTYHPDPELVEEAFNFCLDGTTPLPPQQQQQQSTAVTGEDHSNQTKNAQAPPPLPPLPNVTNPHQTQHQQVHVVMERNLSENSTSTASQSPAGTSSSLSTQLASPITTLAKEPMTWGYQQQEQQQQQEQLQQQECDDDDFYSGLQSPLPTPPTHPSETDVVLPDATALDIGRGTPPSTLYPSQLVTTAGGHQQQQAQSQAQGNPASNNNHTTTSKSSSGLHDNTNVSPAGPAFLMDGGSNNSNRNTKSTPRKSSKSSSQKQAVLYSAIGSLENCSAHSLKNMWHKNKQQQQQPGGNGFAKFDTAHLIAPPSLSTPSPLTQRRSPQQQQAQSQQQQQNPGSGSGNGSPANAAEAQASTRSTPDKFGDSNIGMPQQPTTPSAIGGQLHQSSALKDSLRSMQEKLDARNRLRYGSSSHVRNTSNTQRASMPPQQPSAATSEASSKQPRPSSMRSSATYEKRSSKSSSRKSVTIDDASLQRKQRKIKKPVEMFRPSCDAYTPRMERKKIAYKPAEQRTPVQKMATTMGTLSRPNFRDALRRVAMLLRQHIVKIEERFKMNMDGKNDEGLFKMSMKDAFSEEKFATCRYKCTVVRVPMARPGMVFGLKKIRPIYEIPSEEEIYEFAHQLFKTVQLSSECSIVCLIYIERLMEASKVPLLASTWRPIFLCGLLLASKVWQDLSSWNIEFASVYPQFSLDAINKLELQFLRMVKWDLYISSRYVQMA